MEQSPGYPPTVSFLAFIVFVVPHDIAVCKFVNYGGNSRHFFLRTIFVASCSTRIIKNTLRCNLVLPSSLGFHFQDSESACLRKIIRIEIADQKMQSPGLIQKYTLLFANGYLYPAVYVQVRKLCSFRMTSFLRLLQLLRIAK
jgi:hypothetical protein